MGRWSLNFNLFLVVIICLGVRSSMGFVVSVTGTTVNQVKITQNAQADDYSDRSSFASPSNPEHNPSPHPKRDLHSNSELSSSSNRPSSDTFRPNDETVARPRFILPRGLSSHPLHSRRQTGFLKQEERLGFLDHDSNPFTTLQAHPLTRPIEKHDLLIPVGQQQVPSIDKTLDPLSLQQDTLLPPGFLHRVLANDFNHFVSRRTSNIPIQDRRPTLQIFIIRDLV